MQTSIIPAAFEKEPSVAGDLAVGLAWLVWRAIRLPLFTVLVILEPVVRVALTAIALLGILIVFFFKFSGAAPHLPFWGMFGISVGFGLLLILYHAAIRLLAR